MHARTVLFELFH